MSPPRIRWGWVVVLCLTLVGWSANAAARFEVSLDRSTITMDETAVLTLTFEDCQPTTSLEVSPIPDLQFGNPQQGQKFTMVNGQQTTVLTLSYELHPAKDGEYTIGPIRTTLSTGQKAASKPLTLKVTKSTLPKPSGAPEPAFITLSLPRQEIYLGETVPVDIKCYWQQASGIQRPQLDAPGFRTGRVVENDTRSQIQYAGQIYNQLVLHAPVSPVRSGTLALGPAKWSLSILYGPRDFFGRPTQQRQVNVTSDTVQVQVLPLPTNNVPPNFAGSIGSFQLAAYEAGPTNVAVGDPITLKLRISGAGNFSSISLNPDQQAWGNFKLYPPTSKFEATDPLETEGSKYFEMVVLPQNTSIKELPPFSFSFFDPVKKSYQTLVGPAIPITVRPTVAAPQPTVFATTQQQSDAPAPAREIVHIKPSMGKLRHSSAPFLLRPGFWALECLAPLVWIGTVAWRKRREALANNPRLVRQREVARTVRQGLKELPALAQANKKDEFHAAVFRLLQEVLGERLDQPSSAITEAVLDSLSTENPDMVTAARELFQTCNQYRYASGRSGEELASMIPKVENTLAALQRVTPKSKGKTAVVASSAVIALLVASSAQAQAPAQMVLPKQTDADVAAQFTAANRLYEQGKFADAASKYNGLIQSGWSSPALYFNCGNAWFKAGQMGRAILAYRQAERLAPRDPDIRANLQFARTELGVANSRQRGALWTRLLGRLTLNEWTVIAGIITAGFFGALTASQLAPGRKGLRVSLILLGIASAGSIACAATAAQNQLNDPIAVVISADTVIRRGPFPESPSVITARDGTELLVVDSNNEWIEVTDSAKHTGWVQRADVGFVK